ncbi:MAG TPA: hypothetical protein VFF06_15845 [Polyangia bacterium]|nr:hypothetical protein [Polyangia bacterium]
MTVGSFLIAIEDPKGRVVATLERTSRAGRPAAGDELALDGQLYRVERVRWEDEPEDRTVRRYLNARLFVRAVGREPRVLPLRKRR